MARVANVPGRRRKGSVGSETYRFVKGNTVVSEKSEGSSFEPTEIQNGNRSAMSVLLAASKVLKPIIDMGFVEMTRKLAKNKGRRSTSNFFLGINRKYSQGVFDYGDDGFPYFLPENLVVSKGSIAPTNLTSATGDVSTQTITLTWPTSSLGVNQHSTDLPFVALYNQNWDRWGIGEIRKIRSDGTGTVSFLGPPLYFEIDDSVRIYFLFKKKTSVQRGFNNLSSNSTNRLITIVP